MTWVLVGLGAVLVFCVAFVLIDAWARDMKMTVKETEEQDFKAAEARKFWTDHDHSCKVCKKEGWDR